MRSDLVVSLVVGRVLILLISLPRWLCRRSPTAPRVPQRTRATREPKPFAGDTRTPECALCDAGMDAHPQAPGAPPPRMIFPRGRRRQVDTTGQCCPQATCSYSGGVDWGTIRANGHPHGRPWRQRVCLSCSGSFLETHDTPFHAKQVDPDTLVWAMAAGLTDRVWSVRELLMSRVPPWPQRPMGAGLRTAETGHKPRGQGV